jgi:predicted dienelactone hydrolase
MRFLETTIVGVIFITLIGQRIPKLRKSSLLQYLPFATVILIPIHLLAEDYRWQMMPVFVFAAALLIVSIFQMRQPSDKKFLITNKALRTLCVVLSFLLFAASIIFPTLLPIVNLPEPTGPYTVGTSSYRMIDSTREEIFTKDPDDDRNLLITAWYPAEMTKGLSVQHYWDRQGVTGKAYSINADMGTFWYSHLSLVKTNSYQDAPLAAEQAPFPVLIYSPSFYGLNTENTMLLEELASHGYVIFSIAHTYETIVSIFPNGEIVHGDLDTVFELFDAHADVEEKLYVDYEKADNLEEKTDLVKQIFVVDEEATNILRVRTEDAIFVLDEIETLNTTESIFKGKLDLDQVGILGWSFGGATAMEACIADSRFKAGINIDGWPYGALFNTDQPLTQPFMLIGSEAEDEMETIVSDLIYEKIENAGYALSIKDAWHINFWDFPLFFDVYKHIGYWGTIDALRLREINRAYAMGFFDKHLRGKNVDLLDDPLYLYPEVRIEVKSP